jgi:hypothetical protein
MRFSRRPAKDTGLLRMTEWVDENATSSGRKHRTPQNDGGRMTIAISSNQKTIRFLAMTDLDWAC